MLQNKIKLAHTFDGAINSMIHSLLGLSTHRSDENEPINCDGFSLNPAAMWRFVCADIAHRPGTLRLADMDHEN